MLSVNSNNFKMTFFSYHFANFEVIFAKPIIVMLYDFYVFNSLQIFKTKCTKIN